MIGSLLSKIGKIANKLPTGGAGGAGGGQDPNAQEGGEVYEILISIRHWY